MGFRFDIAIRTDAGEVYEVGGFDDAVEATAAAIIEAQRFGELRPLASAIVRGVIDRGETVACVRSADPHICVLIEH